MKYLKFFEKFESDKLSKVLGYIPEESQKLVIDKLRKSFFDLDFPMSKITDDYIEYLPFKKALWKNDNIEDKPCVADSEIQFDEFGIEGEKCDNGKIKRLWGDGVRKVVCPVCNGSGVRPKKSEIKLIKFWFDVKGNLKTITCVDGLQVKKVNKDNFDVLKKINYDYLNPSDGKFKKIDATSFNEKLNNYENGQQIGVKFERYGYNRNKYIIGYLYKHNDYNYLVNDEQGGTIPRIRKWKKYGKKAINLYNQGYPNYTIIEYLDIIEKEDIVDPYLWNKNYKYRSVENNVPRASIKDSHFALVLDMAKLKKSDYKNVTDIRTDREDSKKGALALKSDKEIKKANIERYVKELSKRLNVSDDISDLNKVLKKLLSKHVLCDNYSNIKILENLVIKYENILKSDKEEGIDRLNSYIKITYEDKSSYHAKLKNIIDDFDTDDKYNYIFELENYVYNKLIKNMKFECIEDLEYLIYKYKGIISYIENKYGSILYYYTRNNYYPLSDKIKNDKNYDIDKGKVKVIKRLAD
jgi:hypothetical protein